MNNMKEMERSLGLFSVVAIALSAMLGSGIFILPGLAANMAGSSVWLAYLLAGVCTFPAAASKAEMATAMPTSGGAFIYLDRSFGPLVGTIVGVAVWLASLLKASFALIGVGVYLVLVAEVPVKPTALVLLAMIVALNWLGVKAVGRAQMFIMGAVIVFITFLSILTLIHWAPSDSGALRQQLRSEGGGIVAAAAFLSVSFNGVTKIGAIAEEVRNPAKVLPAGTFVALGLTTALYAVVAVQLAETLTPEQFHGNQNPIHTWAQVQAGPIAASIAAFFGVITLASLANTGMLAASRFPFAMGRDHLVPGALSRLSSRFNTPANSIVLTGVAMAVAIVLLDVAKLAKLASSVVIALYVVNCMAVIAFRESRAGWYRPQFKVPLYPWIPAFGVVSGVVLLAQFGMLAVYSLLLAIVPGTIVFLFYGRSRAKRRGLVFQRGRRADLMQASKEKHSTGPVSSSPDSVAATLMTDHLNDLDEYTPAPSSVFPRNEIDVADAITGRARAVVAMFGDERGPETLAEIGTALSGWGRLPVVHLTEVPEQTILGAMGDAPALVSLRRRLRVMAEEEGAQLEFHAVNSRDIVRTVHAVTSRVECDFLVMRWRGNTRWAFMPYNPLGWLVDHLDCNLALFRDSGVRYIREILVFAEPGPHDALVVGTADDLARRWGARITLIRPLRVDADSDKRQAELAYLNQLSELCEASSTSLLIEGNDVVSAIVKECTDYDLIVMGLPQAHLGERLLGTPVERIARKAACSVMMLKTPRIRTHEAFARRHDGVPTQLHHFLNREAVFAQVPSSRKEALFEYIAGSFSKMLSTDSKVILEALWERERTQNTSVGHGVALPHATLAGVSQTVVGIFTLKEPVNYHGPDGEKVDVAFVILSPPSERQRHLELLSSIARLAMTTDMLERLRSVSTAEQVIRIVEECELDEGSPPEPPIDTLN